MESQCVGCSIANVNVVLSSLQQNQPPQQLAQTTTDLQGNYEFGQNVTAPDGSTTTLEQALQGQRNVIVVANVSQTAGLGGVDELDLRAGNAKDFNVPTQVACVASVFLTQGTSGNGCVVQADCSGGPAGCIPTLPPEALDDARIANLDLAAATIQGEVVLPNDQACAACAIVNVTGAGSNRVTGQPIRDEFIRLCRG